VKKITRYFVVLIFFTLFSFQESSAELLKPNIKLKPFDVVKIQLAALKNNNKPYKNAGIEQTWEFAHPSNKNFTGPLSRFIKLLNDEGYNILLNHIEHKVVEVYKSEKKFIYEVTILDGEKNFFKYNWQIEKFLNEGSLNNCWLTTSVSLPVSLGSSI
tara:strand:- start:115 stop:588 length:474 start_codon:yes stop_codon:yes gene_type:complete